MPSAVPQAPAPRIVIFMAVGRSVRLGL